MHGHGTLDRYGPFGPNSHLTMSSLLLTFVHEYASRHAAKATQVHDNANLPIYRDQKKSIPLCMTPAVKSAKLSRPCRRGPLGSTVRELT